MAIADDLFPDEFRELFPVSQCSYLPDRKSRLAILPSSFFNAAKYENALVRGFRRNGSFFYCPCCDSCRECTPIRIPVRQFHPDRSQRRNLKLNSDWKLEIGEYTETDEDWELFRDYSQRRHGQTEITRAAYREFLVENPLPGVILRYRTPEGRLVGTAWCDLLPHSLSAVYFAFDVAFSSRAPGIYSILRQIEYCRAANLEYLQLGFYIRDCRKMSYKTNFRPCELADGNVWTAAAERK